MEIHKKNFNDTLNIIKKYEEPSTALSFLVLMKMWNTKLNI